MLVFQLFNGTGNELYFIPLNVSDYLFSVNQSIPIPDQAYSYTLNDTIVFDHSQLNDNDTVRYQFNPLGLLNSYQIFYNGSLAFTLELKTFSLGGFDPLIITVIITISASTALITAFIILRKKNRKKSGKKQGFKTKKLLRKIK